MNHIYYDPTYDEVYRAKDGSWECLVDGKVYGSWNDKGAATAGMKTEQKRAEARRFRVALEAV